MTPCSLVVTNAFPYERDECDFNLGLSGTVVVLTCFVMCVCVFMCGFYDVWVCVCVGFVMCGCVHVWVL